MTTVFGLTSDLIAIHKTILHQIDT